MKITAKASFRLGNTRRQSTFSFWISELRSKSNQLTALRRKLKNLRLTDDINTQYYRGLSSKYRLLSAKFKRRVLDTRKTAWKNFFTNQSDPFGTAQKFFTRKFFTPDEVKLELPSSRSSRQENLEHLTKSLFGPSSLTSDDNSDIIFEAPPDKPFSKAKVATALRKLNDKKAPGPVCIDFRILKLTFKIIPKKFTCWANFCLSHHYFSLTLRQGEVVYFLKQGNDASEPTSYC